MFLPVPPISVVVILPSAPSVALPPMILVIESAVPNSWSPVTASLLPAAMSPLATPVSTRSSPLTLEKSTVVPPVSLPTAIVISPVLLSVTCCTIPAVPLFRLSIAELFAAMLPALSVTRPSRLSSAAPTLLAVTVLLLRL